MQCNFLIISAAFCAITAAHSSNSNVYYTTNSLLPNVIVRAYPHVYSAHSSSLVTPTQQQYHTQDGLGQYAYGYSEPLSSKREVHTLDGITRGSYSYRDATGKLQTVDYTADDNGFRVAATNLPQPVQMPTFRTQETTAFAAITPTAAAAPTSAIVTDFAASPTADTVDIAASPEIHLAARQKTQLRLAQRDSIDNESVAIDASNRALELPNTLENHNNLADSTTNTNQLKAQAEKFKHQLQTVPITAYQSIIPSIYNKYGFGYPLNSRFLASAFYY